MRHSTDDVVGVGGGGVGIGLCLNPTPIPSPPSLRLRDPGPILSGYSAPSPANNAATASPPPPAIFARSALSSLIRSLISS